MHGLMLGASSAVLLGACSLLHRQVLKWGRGRLSPPGKMVWVHGHRMHVYAEGE